MVFLRLYPIDSDDFENLREDAAEAESQRRQLFLRARKRAKALGFGFRCGFLGMLHMEIIQQRLETRKTST